MILGQRSLNKLKEVDKQYTLDNIHNLSRPTVKCQSFHGLCMIQQPQKVWTSVMSECHKMQIISNQVSFTVRKDAQAHFGNTKLINVVLKVVLVPE